MWACHTSSTKTQTFCVNFKDRVQGRSDKSALTLNACISASTASIIVKFGENVAQLFGCHSRKFQLSCQNKRQVIAKTVNQLRIDLGGLFSHFHDHRITLFDSEPLPPGLFCSRKNLRNFQMNPSSNAKVTGHFQNANSRHFEMNLMRNGPGYQVVSDSYKGPMLKANADLNSVLTCLYDFIRLA